MNREMELLKNEMSNVKSLHDELNESMETMKSNLAAAQTLLSTAQQSSSSSSSSSLSSSSLSELQSQLSSLETRLELLSSSSITQPKLVSDVSALQTNVEVLATSLREVKSSQRMVSSQIAVLQEDWDGRQQAFLAELSLVKTQLSAVTTPEEDGAARGNAGKSRGFFRTKQTDDGSMMLELEVLREDEKRLKERVLADAGTCSDRYVRLTQQMETFKLLLDEMKSDHSVSMKKLEVHSEEMGKVVKEQIGQMQEWYKKLNTSRFA